MKSDLCIIALYLREKPYNITWLVPPLSLNLASLNTLRPWGFCICCVPCLEGSLPKSLHS